MEPNATNTAPLRESAQCAKDPNRAFELACIRFAGRSLIAVPLVWLLSMFICYVGAARTLGRWPRPVWDDPGGIAGGWKWLYHLSWGFFMPGIQLMLALIVVLLVALVIHRPTDWEARLVEMGIAIALMTYVVLGAGWHLEFVTWYFD